MVDCMSYPKEPMEFIKGYSFMDSDEVYTNGSELVPLFRVEQMLEHYHKPYRDKQEQGLLIELPCKVGDTFWEVSWSNDSFYPRVAHSLQHCCYVKDRLGTWCFLTEAEAEEALAKMGGK